MPDRSLIVENELKAALAELEKTYDMMLEAFGDALQLKDVEIQAHSKRVTAYTIAIGREMGLPKEETSVIARGAFLHDFGKISLPESILFNVGILTASESDLMKTHCIRGYEVLRKLPFLTDAAEIVFAHHERYDGTGYPRGLVGKEIPLGARIVAVANAFDSITSNLPYRPAQSSEAAQKEIDRCSGSQFDPEVVSAFLDIPKHTLGKLRSSVNRENS